MTKYYKNVNGRRVAISNKDRWKIAKPILVEVLWMIMDYIFNKDEEYKDYD